MEVNPMKTKTCLVFVLSLLVLSSQLLAFDGQRKGFILGGGLGGGSLHYSEYDFTLNQFAGTGNFKIGYAPSNSLEIYFTDNVSVFSYEGVNFGIGIGGVGVTKYLKPEGKGFFVFGGVGVSLLQNLSRSGDSLTGFGLIGGIGSDISKHWSIQGDILYTSMESNNIKSLVLRVTINFLAF
jgi:hypothetical protein